VCKIHNLTAMLYKKKIFINTGMALFALLLFASCKKDAPAAAPDPFYSVTIDGFSVTFNNQTAGASSYSWDFGDGSSSSEESPTHIYPAKGKYVPTLTAKADNGASAEASTVLFISKGSSVKLDDNSLADWDTVATNVVLAGPGSANFIKAKYDYDGNYLYVYFEQNTTKAAGNIYDLYIDVDNNPATGLITGDIPNGAYEVLLEGTIFDGWLDPYYFTGTDQANFGGYASAGISDFWTVGDYVEANGVLKFEFGIKRSKVKGLSSTKGLKIGIQAAANDWSAIVGYSPDLGNNPFFLDMSE
jgi:PKD repeat protein